MNILFIHGNFPAQFANIAPEMAKRLNAKVVFLTLAENDQKIQLPGVINVRFALHRSPGEQTHHYLQVFEEAVLKGQAVLRALHGLSEKGFTPDVVICHGGMGFGLYIKALLPNVKIVSYQEWYFTHQNATALSSEPDINHTCRLETRNAPLLQEMVQADEIVCPTLWQSKQFPPEYRDRIRIIFDGVNRDFFKPALPQALLSLKTESSDEPLNFDSDQLLLSYGTRGMEPLRGFPEFMRAAAAAQQAFPNLQVVIFGRDRNAYSFEHAQFGGSWREAMLDELKNQLDLSRLHFTGLLSYLDLVRLFQRSDLHCYFTRPYVVSWGVFQAAACGANLLVNEFDGLEEVFGGRPNNPTVNLEDQESVTHGVLHGLEQRCQQKEETMNQIPKSTLNPDLELQRCLDQWEKLLKGMNC